MVEIIKVKGFAKLPSIKELFRKTYASIVLSKFGTDDPDELQLYFAPDKIYKNPGGGTKIPKDWKNYSEGLRSPKKRNVKVAEIFFPGTEKWAKMIFWDVITGDFSHDSDFDKILSEIPGSKLHRILMDNKPTNNMFNVSLMDLPLKLSKLRLLDASEKIDGLILMMLKAEKEKSFLCKKLIMNEFRETLMILAVVCDSNYSFFRLYLLLKSRFCYKWSKHDFINHNPKTSLKEVNSIFFYERLLRLILLNFAESLKLVNSRDEKIKFMHHFGSVDKEIRAYYSSFLANREFEDLNNFMVSFLIDEFGFEVVDRKINEFKS